jgi:putative phage-type endonuclease
MRIVDIPQGSEAWHQHRRSHLNASDAPAMMGCSPYKTRSALLREMHTGVALEADAATQRLYDGGHRAEALARPIAEGIVGEELYPITKANGRYSASLDGETLGGEIDFEHKTLNDELRAAIVNDSAELPLLYRVQMEHQLHCSGAERTLFMASRWDGDTLIEERHCWYYPDLALRAQILAGWAQFEADLAAYVPTDAVPVVVAAAMPSLPAVSVQVQGSLAVVSNLQPFGVALRAFIAGIPKKPSTDQEFADTDAACKRLKEAEDRLQQAEDSALASMADVETMRRFVADFRDLARTARLASEKLVTARKAQIREEEVRRGAVAFAAHVSALNERLGDNLMPIIKSDFGAVIKGLKTLDSVRNAIETELARLKIDASALADKIDVNLKAITAANAPTLFPDKAALVLKARDDLGAIIAQRVAAEQLRQDQERERIRLEEVARLEREAAATQNSQPQETAAPPAQAASVATIPAAAVRGGGGGIVAPTLNLGQIVQRLGFIVSAEFLETLGFQARVDRSSRLYREDQFPAMCAAIAAHVTKVAAQRKWAAA